MVNSAIISLGLLILSIVLEAIELTLTNLNQINEHPLSLIAVHNDILVITGGILLGYVISAKQNAPKIVVISAFSWGVSFVLILALIAARKIEWLSFLHGQYLQTLLPSGIAWVILAFTVFSVRGQQ